MRAFLAGVAVVTLAACGGSSAKAAPKPHALAGTIQITGIRTWLAQDGDGSVCWGTGGFSDIRDGTQVRVLDDRDRTIALGRVTGASRVGDGYASDSRCDLTWRVAKVPRARFYKVSVAGRGGPTYSHADLVREGWNVTLTLDG